MLDTKTQTQTNASTEVKSVKSKAHHNKPNNKKWWIGGLVLVLLFSVGGSMVYMLNQKTSKSQASLCKPNEKGTNCIKPKPKAAVKPLIKKPLIQNVKPAVPVPETNPFTGEKQ
jgi:hypothetical protein